MRIMFLLFFLMLFLISCSSEQPNIGACPTMHNLLKDKDIGLVDSSMRGFMSLKAGSHDFVITGRPPVLHEKTGLETIVIMEGKTIVSSSNAHIYMNELRFLQVSSCVDNYNQNNFISLPCDTYPEKNSLKLISWSDWNGQPFLTIYDSNTGLKSMEFRGVYLTGREDDKRIHRMAKTISAHLN